MGSLRDQYVEGVVSANHDMMSHHSHIIELRVATKKSGPTTLPSPTADKSFTGKEVAEPTMQAVDLLIR